MPKKFSPQMVTVLNSKPTLPSWHFLSSGDKECQSDLSDPLTQKHKSVCEEARDCCSAGTRLLLQWPPVPDGMGTCQCPTARHEGGEKAFRLCQGAAGALSCVSGEGWCPDTLLHTPLTCRNAWLLESLCQFCVSPSWT